MSVTQKAHSAQRNQEIPEATRLRLFKLQVEIRYCEKRAYDLFLQNLVKGTSHLALGQEAVAAGFAAAMNPDDYTFCTYRGHHHTLARGAPMLSVLGELMGRQCGLMKGKGGSMHLTSVAHGVMGSYAIVGAHPVVFCCENNMYMEYTPISAVTAVKHPAADRAASYGLERQVIDGNDADVVYSAARDAFAKARSGGGPSLIECLTYRHSGHSRADPAKYRPKEELEEWLKRDPVTLYRNRLLASGVAEGTLAKIESEAMTKLDQATEAAKASPTPSLESAMSDVWADGGNAWRN
ncbi:MAG: thiamine pyrophosphate-dependent dehydrogenase E1 component subunit alpha [Betaproteobacteria bacterium]|nr:MAG: thiamine pyrophosphate-dependent dehydrogenase E1 component subunit alpha [Betaproteobacteria bacterium]